MEKAGIEPPEEEEEEEERPVVNGNGVAVTPGQAFRRTRPPRAQGGSEGHAFGSGASLLIRRDRALVRLPSNTDGNTLLLNGLVLENRSDGRLSLLIGSANIFTRNLTAPDA